MWETTRKRKQRVGCPRLHVSGRAPVVPMSHKQKILIIDNSRMIHSVVKARLNEDELEFHSALDGEEGIRIAGDLHPDTILLDVDMPLVNGFEVCRRLKADPALSPIPVIFLTGQTSTAEKVKGLNLGAIDYITKPCDVAELQARVRAALRTKELVDLLATRALVDGLTGLRNRAYFDQRLVEELARERRARTPLACCMADVDQFKRINDTHGHGFGDMVLRGVAQIISDSCREEDVVCRFGGEEFVILTPGVNGAGARVLAERVRANIAAHVFMRGGVSLNITCSFGVSETTGGESPVEAADAALYRAKSAGRNQVVCAA